MNRPPQTPWGEWIIDAVDDPGDIQDGASLGFHIFMWGSWAVIALIALALFL